MFKEYLTIYQSPSHMYKKLRETEVKKKEDQLYLIKEVLNRMKKAIKNVSENKTFKTEENKKVINITERILYFNQLEQKRQGLKTLIANQTLSRLPISYPIKSMNNSEKRKNEIRQLLYSLYRSKKLTKQLYKSLIDII